MTTDFVITVEVRPGEFEQFARTFKRVCDLHGRRLFEKLEIERRYWSERGIDWALVTDADIPDACWRNIDWMYDCWTVDQLEPLTVAEVEQIANHLIAVIHKKGLVTLSVACSDCDVALRFGAGTALKVARFLFANCILVTDLTKRIWPSRPMSIAVNLQLARRRAHG